MDTTPIQPNDSEVSNCVPPKTFKRNEFGLICDGIQYVYNEDGSINWRKMIKPEYLVPNKQVFEKRGKSVPENIQGLDDRELLILLGGIKDLAQVRGYSCVNQVVTSTPDRVSAVCSITYIPNYETEGRTVIFSDGADATPENTSPMGRQYLTPIAINRAFVRAVRNFLKINIVSQEEVGPLAYSETDNASTSLLKNVMKEFGVTFEVIKNALIKDGVEKAADFTSPDEIPRFKQFELIERIKRKAAEKASSAQ